MRGRLQAWLTPVPQDLKSILFVEGKEGEREISSPPHTHLKHKLKIQTTSNISSDPTFQMDLSPASLKLPPKVACLHLNSLHASWICSPLQSGLLHLKPIPRVTRSLLIWNQPTIFQGLTLLVELNRLILPWLPNLIPPFSLAIHCVSPLLPSLLSLWVSSLLILTPKSASLSLGFHLHRFSYYLLSEKYTGFLLIPGLSLEHQTLTSNDLQDASTFNFKIIELQGRAGIGTQWG